MVVNDRSTDGTEKILSDICTDSANINLITVKELSQGWLGKVYAMFRGYQATNEEWLLFTDADVVFESNALNKAISYALGNRLDHLTILPQIESRSGWLNATLVTFRMMLEMKTRPWLISSLRSKSSLGIGAFNLVEKSVYEKIGTHEVLRMRPDDDV